MKPSSPAARISRADAGAALLRRGRLTSPSGKPEEIDEIPAVRCGGAIDAARRLDDRVKIATEKISDRDRIVGLVDCDDIGIFHLASGRERGGEQKFRSRMPRHLDGTRYLLEAARRARERPRLVFASSIASSAGRPMPASVGDA